MSTVKDRLKEIMDALGLKPLSPASTCDGITKNMMYKLWQSETDNVSSNILEPFCKKYLNVNCNYLIRGEGEMFLGVEKDTAHKNVAPKENIYYEMCKILLENRNKDTELYSRLAELMSKDPK